LIQYLYTFLKTGLNELLRIAADFCKTFFLIYSILKKNKKRIPKKVKQRQKYFEKEFKNIVFNKLLKFKKKLPQTTKKRPLFKSIHSKARRLI